MIYFPGSATSRHLSAGLGSRSSVENVAADHLAALATGSDLLPLASDGEAKSGRAHDRDERDADPTGIHINASLSNPPPPSLNSRLDCVLLLWRSFLVVHPASTGLQHGHYKMVYPTYKFN